MKRQPVTKSDFMNAEVAMFKLIGTVVYEIDFYYGKPVIMRGEVIGFSVEPNDIFYYKTSLKVEDKIIEGSFNFDAINKRVFFSKESAEAAIAMFNTLHEMWEESSK